MARGKAAQNPVGQGEGRDIQFIEAAVTERPLAMSSAWLRGSPGEGMVRPAASDGFTGAALQHRWGHRSGGQLPILHLWASFSDLQMFNSFKNKIISLLK